MRIEPLHPMGARVEGLDLRRAGAAERDSVRALLAERGVAVLRGADPGEDAPFAGFLSDLGEPTFTLGETPVEGHPMLNVVTNAGRTTPPRSSWHSDTSYVPRPPAYTALRPVALPESGGETLFADTARAWETLPRGLRRCLRGRTVLHGPTGVPDATTTRHPLVRLHPVSRREALFLTSPARMSAVSGLDDARSARLIDLLCRHATRRGRVLAHAWAPGDVVIWDNRCTLHRADHSATAGVRTLHRGMTLGEVPIPA